MQCLLNSSETLCGLTGDQSWIEGLVKGKLTCYQTMTWKQGFFDSFLSYVKEKFTDQAEIYKFYEAQKKVSDHQDKAWTDINYLYQNKKTELTNQATQLADFIKQDKNLNKQFDQFINDAKAAKELIRARVADKIITKPAPEPAKTPKPDKTSDSAKLDPFAEAFDKLQISTPAPIIKSTHLDLIKKPEILTKTLDNKKFNIVFPVKDSINTDIKIQDKSTKNDLAIISTEDIKFPPQESTEDNKTFIDSQQEIALKLLKALATEHKPTKDNPLIIEANNFDNKILNDLVIKFKLENQANPLFIKIKNQNKEMLLYEETAKLAPIELTSEPNLKIIPPPTK